MSEMPLYLQRRGVRERLAQGVNSPGPRTPPAPATRFIEIWVEIYVHGSGFEVGAGVFIFF